MDTLPLELKEKIVGDLKNGCTEIIYRFERMKSVVGGYIME